MYPGKIIVRPSEITIKKAPDSDKQIEPYLRIAMGSQFAESPHDWSIFPTFHNSFTLVHKKEKDVCIEAFDKVSHKSLGSLKVDLKPILETKIIHQEYLKLHDGVDDVGMITIDFEFIPTDITEIDPSVLLSAPWNESQEVPQNLEEHVEEKRDMKGKKYLSMFVIRYIREEHPSCQIYHDPSLYS